MIIETRFNIKDTVFYIKNNKVVEDVVIEIQFNKYIDNSGGINYRVSKSSNGMWTYFNEKELFATKEELINSL